MVVAKNDISMGIIMISTQMFAYFRILPPVLHNQRRMTTLLQKTITEVDTFLGENFHLNFQRLSNLLSSYFFQSWFFSTLKKQNKKKTGRWNPMHGLARDSSKILKLCCRTYIFGRSLTSSSTRWSSSAKPLLKSLFKLHLSVLTITG